MAKMNKWVIMDYIIVRDWVYIVCQMLGDKEGVPKSWKWLRWKDCLPKRRRKTPNLRKRDEKKTLYGPSWLLLAEMAESVHCFVVDGAFAQALISS